MSPRVAAMLSVLVLAFTAVPAASADSATMPHRAPRCRGPAGAKILAQGPRLVMWLARRSRRRATTPPEWESTETYAACVPPRGRTRVIAYVNEEAPVQCGSSIALKHAGSFVASVNRFGCSSGSQESLALHDVLRGHTTEVITYLQSTFVRPYTPTSLEPLGPPFGLTISRFALDRAATLPGRARTVLSAPKPHWTFSTSTMLRALSVSPPRRRSAVSPSQAMSSRGGPPGQHTPSPARGWVSRSLVRRALLPAPDRPESYVG
jgi:hypothetical protein